MSCFAVCAHLRQSSASRRAGARPAWSPRALRDSRGLAAVGLGRVDNLLKRELHDVRPRGGRGARRRGAVGHAAQRTDRLVPEQRAELAPSSSRAARGTARETARSRRRSPPRRPRSPCAWPPRLRFDGGLRAARNSVRPMRLLACSRAARITSSRSRRQSAHDLNVELDAAVHHLRGRARGLHLEARERLRERERLEPPLARGHPPQRARRARFSQRACQSHGRARRDSAAAAPRPADAPARPRLLDAGRARDHRLGDVGVRQRRVAVDVDAHAFDPRSARRSRSRSLHDDAAAPPLARDGGPPGGAALAASAASACTTASLESRRPGRPRSASMTSAHRPSRSAAPPGGDAHVEARGACHARETSRARAPPQGPRAHGRPARAGRAGSSPASRPRRSKASRASGTHRRRTQSRRRATRRSVHPSPAAAAGALSAFASRAAVGAGARLRPRATRRRRRMTTAVGAGAKAGSAAESPSNESATPQSTRGVSAMSRCTGEVLARSGRAQQLSQRPALPPWYTAALAPHEAHIERAPPRVGARHCLGRRPQNSSASRRARRAAVDTLGRDIHGRRRRARRPRPAPRRTRAGVATRTSSRARRLRA